VSKLKLIDAKRMERLLLAQGFAKVRQKGSHTLLSTSRRQNHHIAAPQGAIALSSVAS